MPSMTDATCSKCHRRIGWSGGMANRPACPSCGYRPPQEELDAADAEMRRAEELLLSRPNASVCREQRIAAGLTLLQAAKMLGINGFQLSELEWGRAEIDAAMEQKMADVYKVGPCE